MNSKQIIFVTSKAGKLSEARDILKIPLRSESYELEEIQSLDLKKIVEHKLDQAFRVFKIPVIVDDVSVELESLNGLPGPFIRFFEEKLGEDALYKLSKVKNDQVRIICSVGYFDGQKKEIMQGVLTGNITAPRGENGWGFDKIIVPAGHQRTMAEMKTSEKNKLSHRYLAFKKLAESLERL